jgi:betaine lipid synthase
VILMDHVDWQDLGQARELAAVLAKQVAPGGRVIWRSAALCPPYARVIREAGFEVKCLQRADEARPCPARASWAHGPPGGLASP